MKTCAVLTVISISTLLLHGCDPEGETCGRGRCRGGSECVSILGEYLPENNHPIVKQVPGVDDQWWCLRECPSKLECSSMCLENPVDDREVVCAVNSMEVEYYFHGDKQPVADLECVKIAISGYEIYLTDEGAPFLACEPSVPCEAGVFNSGDVILDHVFYYDLDGQKFSTFYLSAWVGWIHHRLGEWLPEDVRARVYVNVPPDMCKARL